MRQWRVFLTATILGLALIISPARAAQGACATPCAKPVKSYGKFENLPAGAITPTGWLKQWTQINADGWLLDYATQKHPNIYGKFWNRNKTSATVFDENNQTITLCDYTAYFADGLLRYGQILPESKLAGEAKSWLKQLVASQDADGYIGAFEPQAQWQHGLEILTQSLTLDGVLYCAEATQDASLIDLCRRASDAQKKRWDSNTSQHLFSGHGTIIVRSLTYLYRLTGDTRYIDFARDVLARHGMTEAFLKSGSGHHPDPLHTMHNVVGSEHVGFPAIVYEYTGDENLLKASRLAWDLMMNNHISAAGTPIGDEMMIHNGPREGAEHCGTVEWMLTSEVLARVTGEVKYADAVERAFFNAYPSAKSVDGKLTAYSHAPNQLIATEWSNPHNFDPVDWWSSRAYYHTAQEPLCCNSNGPRAIPHFLAAMVKRAGDGLAVVYYGPCQARATLPNAGAVTLQMDTEYPLEDTVKITINTEKSAKFPLLLRIPCWCDSAEIRIQGEPDAITAKADQYYEINRLWKPADQITVRFDNRVRLWNWAVAEFKIRPAGVVAQRGVLTYVMPVTENWQPFKPPAQAPTQDPDKVTAYRVFPAEGSAWNYALCLDSKNPEKSFTPVAVPVPADNRPWEHSPIALEVKARRVLNWKMDGEPLHPQTPGLPYNPMQLSETTETIKLVPFGFTHIRMTYLPIVKE